MLKRLLALVSALALIGCSSPKRGAALSDILGPDYEIQYPARPDVHPGEIWQYKNRRLAVFEHSCPTAYEAPESVEAGFDTPIATRIAVAGATFDIAALGRGDIESLRAKLLASGIQELEVSGNYRINSLGPMGPFRTARVLSSFDPDYVDALGATDGRDGGTCLIIEAVTVTDFKYLARVSGAAQVAADLNSSGVIAGAGFTVIDDEVIRWELPSGPPMVVGYKIYPGAFWVPDQALVDAERRRREADDARVQDRLRAVQEYERQLTVRAEELSILNQTYVVWAGKERAKGPNEQTLDLVGPRSPSYCYRDERHVYGFKTHYGGNPQRAHNITFLIRKGDGTNPTETGPAFPPGSNWANGHAPRDVVKLENKEVDVVINCVLRHYQGEDFDGWDFGASSGRTLSARLAGSPIACVSPPSLPAGYDWELSSVTIDGGPWMNGASFTFRACFTDRDRRLTSPVPPQ